MKVGFADNDRASIAQTGHDWRIGSGDVPGSHSRRGGGRHTFDVDQVLDGNRPAMQRAARSTMAQLLVEHSRLLHRVALEYRNEGIERWVQFGDPLERVGDMLRDEVVPVS